MKTTSTLILSLSALFLASCCTSEDIKPVGKLTQEPDHALWAESIWISATDAPVITGKVEDKINSRAADGSSWFVSEIKNDQRVESAIWMTSGLGIYELYLNGSLVGNEILKPGFTHREKTRLSFTYDITEAFKKASGAKNQFSAQVTPGWWADKIVTQNGSEGMFGKKCAFRAVLVLKYEDGTQKVYGTNIADWKAGIAGPVKHAAIFDGEEYDAGEVPGYECADKLGTPEENTEFKGEIVPTNGAEVYFRDDLAMKPISAYVWQGIENDNEDAYGKVIKLREYQAVESIVLHSGETLVIDFGQNCTGVPEFSFKAEKGTLLNCLPSEILNDGNGAKSRGMDGPEGSCHRTNLRNSDNAMRLNYTFAGDNSVETFRPRCTFFGYRYLSITVSDDVMFSKIRSIPVSSITKEMESGKLETGNELINQLISNTIWGQRSNYLSVPTDCPQRNERLGWTADTQVFAETGSFFANTRQFFHKWMRDMRDTQGEFGGFPGVAPVAQYGAEPHSMMCVGWADAGIIVPWTVWKQFGDTTIIEENWEAMERFINHVNESKYDHRALINENRNRQWADWLSFEALETDSSKAYLLDKNGKRIEPLPAAIRYWSYLGASYWAIDAAMMKDMALATGKDANKYIEMERKAKRYIKDYFIKDDGGFWYSIFDTMQTPALFALKNGLLEGQALENVKTRLRQNFIEHGNRLQTGFLGTSILMETLTENGMADIAYELLFQRKNPSWLYSVDNGATTIWERWNSYTKESGMGPKGMNSFNHYAYGCVCQWIWETAAGIKADVKQPGFKHIILRPVPDKRLGYINAEYNSAAGKITSCWKYESDEWIWNFSIPEGSTATVFLPGEETGKEYESGTYTEKISENQ